MAERYDLEKMLKEIVEDEKESRQVKKEGVLSQEDIKRLIAKKQADRSDASS